MDWSNYNSKKFFVVVLLILVTFVLALLGKVTAPVAGILTGIGMVYPPIQSWVDTTKIKNKKET